MDRETGSAASTTKRCWPGGNPAFAYSPPADEWDAISLNYTSGTTGNPKGVVYHHRGAWLTATGNTMAWQMQLHPVYLWTLPMFHCNGWCFPWTITPRPARMCASVAWRPDAFSTRLRTKS